MKKTTKNEIIYGAESINWTADDIRRVERAKKKFSLLIKLGSNNETFFAQSNNVCKLLDAAAKYSKEITADKLTLVINN